MHVATYPYDNMPTITSSKAGKAIYQTRNCKRAGIMWPLTFAAESSPSTSTSTPRSARTEHEYMAMLAKEFNSIPDREVPPPEPQEDSQLPAVNRTCVIIPHHRYGGLPVQQR